MGGWKSPPSVALWGALTELPYFNRSPVLSPCPEKPADRRTAPTCPAGEPMRAPQLPLAPARWSICLTGFSDPLLTHAVSHCNKAPWSLCLCPSVDAYLTCSGVATPVLTPGGRLLGYVSTNPQQESDRKKPLHSDGYFKVVKFLRKGSGLRERL